MNGESIDKRFMLVTLNICRDKWVPVTTARRVLRLRMEERPPIWRAAANILKSSRGQPTRGGPPAWGLGEVLTTTLRKKKC